MAAPKAARPKGGAKKKSSPKRIVKKPKKARSRKAAASLRLPKRQVRTSERTTFKRCRWQHGQNYGERLRPIREAPALRFGTLVHEALELRYPPGIKRGPKPAESFEKIFDANLTEAEREWGLRLTDSDGEWMDMKELGVSMLEMYVEKYGRDEEWEVIESEMTFQVPVFVPDDLRERIIEMGLLAYLPKKGQPLFTYVGTMDGVWRNRMDGGVRINDYKTTKNDPTKEGGGKLTLDEQATAYWTWGADWLIQKGVLKPRDVRALDGMLYTFLRKAKRDPRPQNAEGHYLNLPTKKEKEEFGEDYPGSVSKKQPLPYFHRELVYRTETERERARERVVFEFIEMERIRRGEGADFKTPETGAMGHCGYCPVRDLCELHESGADWETLRDATMTTWDPYAAHEIKEAEQR